MLEHESFEGSEALFVIIQQVLQIAISNMHVRIVSTKVQPMTFGFVWGGYGYGHPSDKNIQIQNVTLDSKRAAHSYLLRFRPDFTANDLKIDISNSALLGGGQLLKLDVAPGSLHSAYIRLLRNIVVADSDSSPFTCSSHRVGPVVDVKLPATNGTKSIVVDGLEILSKTGRNSLGSGLIKLNSDSIGEMFTHISIHNVVVCNLNLTCAFQDSPSIFAFFGPFQGSVSNVNLDQIQNISGPMMYFAMSRLDQPSSVGFNNIFFNSSLVVSNIINVNYNPILLTSVQTNSSFVFDDLNLNFETNASASPPIFFVDKGGRVNVTRATFSVSSSRNLISSPVAVCGGDNGGLFSFKNVSWSSLPDVTPVCLRDDSPCLFSGLPSCPTPPLSRAAIVFLSLGIVLFCIVVILAVLGIHECRKEDYGFMTFKRENVPEEELTEKTKLVVY